MRGRKNLILKWSALGGRERESERGGMERSTRRERERRQILSGRQIVIYIRIGRPAEN